MMNRYYTTEGVYDTFGQKIAVNSLDDIPVFLHELYHHIQNNSTIIGAERLNLVVQFLAQISIIAQHSEEFYFPLSKVFEDKELLYTIKQEAQKAIENIVLLYREWLYLDKSGYAPKEGQDSELGAIIKEDEPAKQAFTPFMTAMTEDGVTAFPVGGYTISESGAFALQLFHTEGAGESILDSIDDEKYPYLLVLGKVHSILNDFKLSCLATFLLCDLAMIISTPAVGFYALYKTLALTLKEGITEEKLLKWYEAQIWVWEKEIKFCIEQEQEMINGIKESKTNNVLTKHIDDMINWLIDILEKGLSLRTQSPLSFVKRLLSGKMEDIASLLKEYPITVIYEKNTDKMQYDSEENLVLLGLMEAVTDLFFGLLIDFDKVINNPEIIHILPFSEEKYVFKIKTYDDSNDSDAYGYIIHLLGLNDKAINLVK